VKLWDAETGECVRTLTGHGGAAKSVAWSPDGHRLASASDDQTVKVWDAKTGECLRTLVGYGSAVWSVGWSVDGRRLASGSQGGAIIVHDTKTYQEIQPRRFHVRVPRGPGSWAAADLTTNQIVACGPGAWRFFSWRVDGQQDLLPAEAFGPLPERPA